MFGESTYSQQIKSKFHKMFWYKNKERMDGLEIMLSEIYQTQTERFFPFSLICRI